MCNGTVALEIGIRALALEGEVIVPSMTFVATAHSLQWQRITPVFADIDPATHNIAVEHIEELITPRTTGIIGVHLWGRPCDVDGLAQIARRQGLRLMFDAAHAFAVTLGGRGIGNFGDLEVFSFHATKFFNTFEGGAITTNDDDLAGRLRLMRNFGFAGYDHVVYVGTNGKMNEISAAMGLTQLDELDGLIDHNRSNHRAYRELLADVPGLAVQGFDEAERQNYQFVVVDVASERTGLTRDQLLEVLWCENVHARRYFFPGCHRMEPYRSLSPDAGVLLPHTEAVLERILMLPSGRAVGYDEIHTVCGILRDAVQRAGEVRARLGSARVPSYYRGDV
jgi:dTDP-4-amino-4,6-dideoxygalactose transaminase